MLKRVIAGLLLAGLLAVPVFSSKVARADGIGPEVEYYRPFSSKTRRAFGSSTTSLGIGFGSTRASAKGEWEPDINILRADEDGDRALLIMAGGQYRRAFAGDVADDDRFVPYYGAGANLVYGRLRVDGDRDNGFGVGTSAFIGTSIGRSAFVEARVRAMTEIEDYNFSGVSLSAGIRF